MTKEINISKDVVIGGNRPFVLIAGPCAIESESMTMEVASTLKAICSKLNIPFIFKSSFDKANRTSLTAPRGVGIEEGLRILKRVKDELQVPVITDVHESYQCAKAAEVVDILQIPAFLARQTDLLLAAAQTGKTVHVKKAQFMAPGDMRNVVNKLIAAGNHNIMLGERGTSFGYNNLVVDMTGLVEMRQLGFPVVFDATHSVQKPGGQGSSTGGNRAMVPPLMRAALAVGVDAVFAEVHPDPDHAFSDGPNQLYLSSVEEILKQAISIDLIAKEILKQDKPAEVPASIPSKDIFREKADKIRVFLTDVDGVLTDSGMYYSNDGMETKKFNAHDGMGMQLIRRRGIKVGFITSENTDIVRNRFNKLKLHYLYQGGREGGKLATALEICELEGIGLDQVAYIGDDLNCKELLQAVGLAACPQDALDEIKQIPGIYVMSKKGGEGCVRELIDLIFPGNEYH